jgi:hypothetical protein
MMVKSWNLLAVAGAVFILLAIGLVCCVVRLVRSNRGDTLISAPLVPQQEINLPGAGEVVVLVKMPQLAAGFSGLQIELTEKGSDSTQVMKYSYASAQGAVHGFDGVKMRFGRMTIPRSATYVARVSGLIPGKDYSSYWLIFSRPYFSRMALQIVGIVVCSVGMLGCLIWGVWLAGLMKQGTSTSEPAGVPGRTVDLETWKRHQQNPPK